MSSINLQTTGWERNYGEGPGSCQGPRVHSNWHGFPLDMPFHDKGWDGPPVGDMPFPVPFHDKGWDGPPIDDTPFPLHLHDRGWDRPAGDHYCPGPLDEIEAPKPYMLNNLLDGLNSW